MKTLTAVAMLLIAGVALAAPAKIEIEHQKPANLFQLGEPVKFNATVKGLPKATGEATAVITDFFGQTKSFAIPIESRGGSTAFVIDLGTPDAGYYDLKVTLTAKDDAGKEHLGDSTVHVTRREGKDKKIQDTDPVCFGVVRFVDRTAEQARQGGYRFGLKLFQIGNPGVWWRRPLVYDVNELCDASRRLGLQWTRAGFNQGPSDQPGIVSTLDLINRHQMNVVLKVEGFPESCYDAARYGPLEEWKKKRPGKSFGKATVPAKGPYQAWLREQLKMIPPEQNIYEMGNEVWDQMSGAEFAEWCQMAVEVIKDVNPNAKVGADPSSNRMSFALPFFQAGGMKQMDIIYSHPYSFTPLPEWRIRPWLRNLQDMVADATGGRRLPIYVTEYGWPTAEKDTRKHSVSEVVQAQRTTRQSLMMYAEDVKALIPHWMADREEDITERENWFGFYRLSGQPKPVLIAHANAARLIDGGRFVGDLWNGPGLASMLFEKDGRHVLAVWTAEEPKDATIDVGVDEVTVVDLMGRETTARTDGGKLKRTFDASVVYFVGVSPSLAKQAVGPDADLSSDLWNVRANAFAAPRARAITVDGKLDEWAGPAVKLTGPDALGSADAYVRWDEKHLYVAMKVADQNRTKPGTIRIGIGTKPGRQQTSPTMYDSVLSLTVSADATTAAKVTGQFPGRSDKAIDLTKESEGVRWALQPTDGGLIAEVAIPLTVLQGFPTPRPETRITCRVAYEKDKASLANSPAPPRFWPYLTLGE